MMKSAHVLAALIASSTFTMPAFADHHEHAAHAKQGAALQAKPGGCMHGEGCKHGAMGGMGKHDGMGMGMSGFAHKLIMQSDALKLTDEQIGKLHRIAMRNMKDGRGAGQMQTAMMKLHKTIMDPAADEAAIKKATADHTAAFQAMVDDAVAQRSEALAVLTADQKKTLKTLKTDDETPAKKE